MTFEQILQTNLINFIIVVSTLVLIFKKAHLGDLIEKLAKDVENKVETSASNASCALKNYKSTIKEVRNTKELQKEILEKAEKNVEIFKEKADILTKKQQKELIKNLEKIITSQEEKSKNITISEIYSSCIELAKEEVIKNLDENTGRKLINSSIDELDKIEGNLF